MGFDANVEFLRIAFWQIILAAGPLLADICCFCFDVCHFKPIIMTCKAHVSGKSIAKTMPVKAAQQFLGKRSRIQSRSANISGSAGRGPATARQCDPRAFRARGGGVQFPF